MILTTKVVNFNENIQWCPFVSLQFLYMSSVCTTFAYLLHKVTKNKYGYE